MQNSPGSSQASQASSRPGRHVAILSHRGAELEAIEREFKKDPRFKVRQFLSLDEVNQGLKTYAPDLLVLRLNVFDTPQVNMVLKARLRFPDTGIITICPDIQPTARYQVKDIYRHKLLLEPFELRDLALVAEKLTSGDPSATRLHARVGREGECELISADKNERIKGRFVDFAQMGTRLLVQPKAPMKKGTWVELLYRSTSEPNRVHRIQSSIVWAEMNSGMMGTIMHGPQQMVGVRFVAAL